MRVDKSVIVLFRQMNLFLNRELLDEKLTSSDVLYLALLYEQDGRTQDEIETLEAYLKAQGLFGIPRAGDIDYSQVVRLNLADVTPSLAGPKRPQDRIDLGQVKQQFTSLFSKPVEQAGFNLAPERLHVERFGVPDAERMGIAYRNGRPSRSLTANGVVESWRVQLNSVRINSVEVYNVDAVVLKTSMPGMLLGNSFLSRFRILQNGDQMVLERRY